jgi:UPF0716 protein FxsA
MKVPISPTSRKTSALPFSLIPFLFLVIPISEITLFVLVGGQIGVLPTIGLVILTAAAGSILLRWQGMNALARIQKEIAANRVPGKELVQGVMILLAGLLLMTPGFLTDVLGLLLFIPPVRDAVWRFLSSRVNVQTFGTGFVRHGAGRPEPGVVDLDEDEYQSEGNKDSPWVIEQDSDKRKR